MKYEFRHPRSDSELEQIFRLNYLTFVDELKQYPPTGDGLLIDKFHARNVYFAAFHEETLAGMIAVHDQPPFSIEQRLADPAILANLPQPKLEVRLLAIHPDHRNTMAIGGLFSSVYIWARDRRFATLLLSGLVDRLNLYRKLGFRELGPAVRYGSADFVPMALHLPEVPERYVRYAGERLPKI